MSVCEFRPVVSATLRPYSLASCYGSSCLSPYRVSSQSSKHLVVKYSWVHRLKDVTYFIRRYMHCLMHCDFRVKTSLPQRDEMERQATIAKQLAVETFLWNIRYTIAWVYFITASQRGQGWRFPVNWALGQDIFPTFWDRKGKVRVRFDPQTVRMIIPSSSLIFGHYIGLLTF